MAARLWGHHHIVCVCVCVCVCVFACEQLGTEVGGVYPSEELFPVVVTNRTPAASHYFTAAAISPSVLSEPDTLTCLSLLLSPSLHIQQSCPPLLLITLPLLRRCSLLEGDTGLLLTHWFCMTVTKVRTMWTWTTLIMSPCNLGFGVRLDCDGYLRCNSHRVCVCVCVCLSVCGGVKMSFWLVLELPGCARLSGCCCCLRMCVNVDDCSPIRNTGWLW